MERSPDMKTPFAIAGSAEQFNSSRCENCSRDSRVSREMPSDLTGCAESELEVGCCEVFERCEAGAAAQVTERRQQTLRQRSTNAGEACADQTGAGEHGPTGFPVHRKLDPAPERWTGSPSTHTRAETRATGRHLLCCASRLTIRPIIESVLAGAIGAICRIAAVDVALSKRRTVPW